MSDLTNISQYAFSKDYGRRLYVADKPSVLYFREMKRITDRAIFNQVQGVQSEFKKPYLYGDYSEMEYYREPPLTNLSRPDRACPELKVTEYAGQVPSITSDDVWKKLVSDYTPSYIIYVSYENSYANNQTIEIATSVTMHNPSEEWEWSGETDNSEATINGFDPLPGDHGYHNVWTKIDLTADALNNISVTLTAKSTKIETVTVQKTFNILLTETGSWGVKFDNTYWEAGSSYVALWDGAKWVPGSGGFTITIVPKSGSSWATGHRPSKIRVTYSGGTCTPLLALYGGSIISYNNPYASAYHASINFVGNDIDALILGCEGEVGTCPNITNIEFLS